MWPVFESMPTAQKFDGVLARWRFVHCVKQPPICQPFETEIQQWLRDDHTLRSLLKIEKFDPSLAGVVAVHSVAETSGTQIQRPSGDHTGEANTLLSSEAETIFALIGSVRPHQPDFLACFSESR